MKELDRPRVALTVGDPSGIGPEIVLAALGDDRVREAMRLVVLGPERLRPADLAAGPADPALHQWIDTGEEGEWELGRPQASAGRAALRALRAGAELAAAGEVAALVTAPVSKEALHLAGERVEGQTQLLARWAGVDQQVEMMAVAGRLRVLLLTRHMPLRAALDAITGERVLDRLRLFDAGLKRFGVARPHLALAGLNPHAGEHGLLGAEEDDVLRPALARAREEGLDVVGPESPDTVFARALRGAFDGVLALYHDQAFIPIKLAAPTRSLTVLLGLPYLRVSPAHGTAFDIAGTGRADPENLIHALLEAARLAQSSFASIA